MRAPVGLVRAVLLSGLAGVLLGVAAPSSQAQVPPLPGGGAPALFKIRLAGSPDSFTIIQSGGSTEFTFVVSFLCYGAQGYGRCDGNLADEDVDVAITETKRGRYPAGWSVAVTPTQFTMKAGGTQRVTARVVLLQDEPAESRFDIELKAVSNPAVDNPAGPIEGNLNQQTQASDSVTVEEAVTLSERVFSLARTYRWVLLGSAVVLVVGAVVLVQRKKGAVHLTTDQPLQEVAPGRGASYPVHVHNESRAPDRVRLEAGELPDGWAAILPLTEVELRADERTQFWVTLRAPASATPGQRVHAELRASSSTGAAREAKLLLQAIVTAPPESTSVEWVLPKPPPLEPAPKRTGRARKA